MTEKNSISCATSSDCIPPFTDNINAYCHKSVTEQYGVCSERSICRDGCISDPTNLPQSKEPFSPENINSSVQFPKSDSATLANYYPRKFMTQTPGYWRSDGTYNIFG